MLAAAAALLVSGGGAGVNSHQFIRRRGGASWVISRRRQGRAALRVLSLSRPLGISSLIARPLRVDSGDHVATYSSLPVACGMEMKAAAYCWIFILLPD
jgi:hypothetical protein